MDGVPGLAYRLEYAADPTASDWSPLVDFTAHTTAPFTFVDTTATGSPARFYRLGAP